MASYLASNEGSKTSEEIASFKPSEENVRQSVQALHRLAEYLFRDAFTWVYSPIFRATPALIANSSGVTLGIIPIGLYALNLWSASEPIVCCVAGSPSSKTFFSLAKKRLRKKEPQSVIIEHSDANGTEFRVHVDSIAFHLKYHQNPLVSQWTDHIDLDDVQEILSALPQESRRCFAELESCNESAAAIDNEIIRSSFWIIRRWAYHFGLISDLGEGLTSQDVLLMSLLVNSKEATSMDIRTLLTHLCENPLDSNAFEQRSKGLGLKKTKMTINKLALIERAQRYTLEQIDEVQTALSKNTLDWNFFFSAYEEFIRIDFIMWGYSSVKGARTTRAIEHAISKLNRRLVKHYPNAVFHTWPRPFAYSEQSGPQRTESYYARRANEAMYFIGMSSSPQEGQNSSLSLPETQTISPWFSKELNASLEDSLDSLYTNVEVVKHVETTTIHPSMKEWGPVSEASRQDDSEDSEEESYANAPKKAKSGASAPGFKSQDSESLAINRPLRPALDILHRIQYDSNLDASDYVIGYLDRHRTELQEMPLEWWVSKETTSEEFIPQSRIRFFKRVSDDTVVWDREARRDLIFGSGKGDY